MASLSITGQAVWCGRSNQTRPVLTLESSSRYATISRSAKPTSLQISSCFLPLGDLSGNPQNRAPSARRPSQLLGNFSGTRLGDRDLAGGASLRAFFRMEKELRAGTVVASAVPFDKGSSGAPVVVSSPEDRSSGNGSSTSKIGDSYDPTDYIRKSAVTSSTASLLMGNRKAHMINAIENRIERVIFNCRFLTLFAVVGSLAGSILCFLKGCLFVSHSYTDYIKACLGGTHTSRVILYLVEAVDVYLMGTVMLIFGMGVYELFISSLEVPSYGCDADGASRSTVCGSNLFGLFRIRQRPAWLEIRSLDELKTKLGHVIVMILLVGLFEKSKKVVVHTSMDFLCFSASILVSSAALYLLSILHTSKDSRV